MYDDFKLDMALIMKSLSMLMFDRLEAFNAENNIEPTEKQLEDITEHKIAALTKNIHDLDDRTDQLMQESALAQIMAQAPEGEKH